MTHRSWPALLPLFLAAVVGQSSLRAQTAMPQELPGHVSVPDVRLPGSEGSLARGALPAPGLDPAAPPLAYPLAQPAESLDPWGWRYSERRSAWRLHTGIDLAAPQGTVVLASRAGRVLLVESISGYGTTVLLDHGEGWQTLYAHLHEAIVVNGVWLEQGQPLGMVGMTGSATGPHLHFELRRQGAELLALDPTPHLPPPSQPPVHATISP
jgi:murein DD-endopeptidase MepM/ murein hydrolase activator NlpD